MERVRSVKLEFDRTKSSVVRGGDFVCLLLYIHGVNFSNKMLLRYVELFLPVRSSQRD